MSTLCSLCGKYFSTRSNLLRHTRTVKQCGGKGTRTCKYCQYTTRDPQNLSRHEKVCDIKKVCDNIVKEMKDQLDEKDATIEDLRKDLEKSRKDLEKSRQEIVDLKIQLSEKKGMLSIKAAPKNVTTNYVNQKLMSVACSTIDPLTVDTVKKSVDAGNYTFQHFKLGPPGIVDFIADIICTEDGQRNYACSDISRNKCHRLIETREWQTDNGATFINKILDELKEQAIAYTQRVADMWKKPEERDYGDELRERTREMASGIIHPKSPERKDLFGKVRAGVKTLASI
jgi:hypothetical protein